MRPAVVAFALSESHPQRCVSPQPQTSRERGTHVFEAEIVACVFERGRQLLVGQWPASVLIVDVLSPVLEKDLERLARRVAHQPGVVVPTSEEVGEIRSKMWDQGEGQFSMMKHLMLV